MKQHHFTLFALSLILFVGHLHCKAQQQKLPTMEALAKELMQQNSEPAKRLEAAYHWVAHHIRYDLKQTNSVDQAATQSQITAKAFESGKAVCEGYAGVFDSLARLMGIPSQLVSGYTRLSGQLDPTPHMWVANYVDGKWLLSDPTFAAGGIENNRFVFEYNPNFLMVKPEKIIETHMPYDPLWQFLVSPVSHQGFYKNRKNECLTDYFIHHSDSLSLYLDLDFEKKMADELRRIKQQQSNLSALAPRIEFLENSLQIHNYNQSVIRLRHISDIFNRAVGAYNVYATSFNKSQGGKKGPINTSQLEKAQMLTDSCELLLRNTRFNPKLIQNAKEVQQAVFEFQKKIRANLLR